MTPQQFDSFCEFRFEFKSYCDAQNAAFASILPPLVQEAGKADTPDYPLETAVVYNTALDGITAESNIRLIVVGDNPGKDEQRSANRAYLVGQSGKLAAGFFSKRPELRTDFRANALILNKTPVHTAKTKHLSFLEKNGGEAVRTLIAESQLFMAKKTAELHQSLLSFAADGAPELWLVGYGELKPRGIFLRYRDALQEAYERAPKSAWERVLVFQHFSMNRFSIDVNTFCAQNERLPLADALRALGTLHRTDIFGR